MIDERRRGRNNKMNGNVRVSALNIDTVAINEVYCVANALLSNVVVSIAAKEFKAEIHFIAQKISS
jgi:NTP pyrophosphatase (non-canonical NTP hydrolase)